jgi:hypothetical protein
MRNICAYVHAIDTCEKNSTTTTTIIITTTTSTTTAAPPLSCALPNVISI